MHVNTYKIVKDGGSSFLNKKGQTKDVARRAFEIQSSIKNVQRSVSCLCNCPIPIICAVDGPCIGGAVALASGCDIRYCTKRAFFSLKEVDVGIAVDISTVSKITGNEGLVRELTWTGRSFSANEALSLGFVSKIFDNKNDLNIQKH